MQTTPGTSIYARVPVPLKEAVQGYADENTLSLTGAAVELLERGLEAAADADSVVTLRQKLHERDIALKDTEVQVQTLQAFAKRTKQPLGTCPEPGCGLTITAFDVLAAGQCSEGHSLQKLIEPPKPTEGAGAGLDQTQYLLLAGAVGLLLAVALSNS